MLPAECYQKIHNVMGENKNMHRRQRRSSKAVSEREVIVSLETRLLVRKPEWWPQCPYPEDIFPMKRTRYLEIVPDPDIRTALSGMLGREFWMIASDAIWHALKEQVRDGRVRLEHD
jgi:hypothetical protein